jgi:uncharacterized protein (DUF433 family)
MIDLRQLDDDQSIDSLIVGDADGQIAWQEMVSERFAQFDYEQGLALIWHVRGRQNLVVIDPRISFGAPTVNGIPTWVLKGRWNAGEDIDAIQDDFHLDRRYIRAGLRFEGIDLGHDEKAA